jgi:chemotaxis family two-component system response regulator PixG
VSRYNRGTILCIDDSSQVRRLMETLLANAGYRVVTVGEAIKALPTLLECNPDAIFLDLMMPIANGYEICTQIRRIDRFKNTPIVILTGNDGLVDRMRAKMVGATDFLAKPIKRDRILAAVGKYVGKYVS